MGNCFPGADRDLWREDVAGGLMTQSYKPTAVELNEQEKGAFDAFDMAFANLNKNLAELGRLIEQAKRERAATDKAFEELKQI